MSYAQASATVTGSPTKAVMVITVIDASGKLRAGSTTSAV